MFAADPEQCEGELLSTTYYCNIGPVEVECVFDDPPGQWRSEKTVGGPYDSEIECTQACVSSSSSSSSDNTANDCNECDPPIPDTLYVEFDGLAGDFAAADKSVAGKIELTWIGACQWYTNVGGLDVMLDCSTVWSVTVLADSLCYKTWTQAESYPCVPEAAYLEFSCDDSGCGDTDSCDDSVGATCAISTS